MTPKSHFYIRTRKDSDPKNPGAHPRIAVKVTGKVLHFAACAEVDSFRKHAARKILANRISGAQGFILAPTDTLTNALTMAGVPKRMLRDLDMDRAERAFERTLESPE